MWNSEDILKCAQFAFVAVLLSHKDWRTVPGAPQAVMLGDIQEGLGELHECLDFLIRVQSEALICPLGKILRQSAVCFCYLVLEDSQMVSLVAVSVVFLCVLLSLCT